MTPPAKKAQPTGSKTNSGSLSDLLSKPEQDEVTDTTSDTSETSDAPVADGETNKPVDDGDTEFDRDEDYTDENEDVKSTVIRPEDIKPPVDNTDKSGLNTSFDDSDKADKPVISNQVVGTVPNKTPAELAAETPAQTASRYGIDQSVTDEDANNPRVQAYRDTHVNQVPAGTHLHPDIAKDMLNRGISEMHTDNAQVKRTVTEYYDFAPDAEHNDKF